MNMNKIKLVEATQLKSDIPDFKAGDTVNVHVIVKEGDSFLSSEILPLKMLWVFGLL